jgi:O-antigen/teichoic acid export membrane protein
MASARHVARNSLVQFAGRGVTMGVSLAILTLLSRYLGPYEFGQYQLVIAFLLLVNISDLGITTIAIRHLSTKRQSESTIMGNILVIRAALASTTTFLAIGLFSDSSLSTSAVSFLSSRTTGAGRERTSTLPLKSVLSLSRAIAFLA